MERSTDPACGRFQDDKVSAMAETVAFPTARDVPTVDSKVTVGLVLLSLAQGMQLLINRQKGETHD